MQTLGLFSSCDENDTTKAYGVGGNGETSVLFSPPVINAFPAGPGPGMKANGPGVL